MPANDFLADCDLRAVALPPATPFQLIGLARGQGTSPLEVLAVAAEGTPSSTKVRSLWKDRNRGRAAPLLLVVLFGDRAVFCGPAAAGGDPPVHAPIERAQAERLCVEALEQPDLHAAHRYLRDALPAVVDSSMPGLRNEGLLATHELVHGARRLSQWPDAAGRARPILARCEEALLQAHGFQVAAHDGATAILRANQDGKRLAVAVLLRPGEAPEVEADRFSVLSPVSYALTVAGRDLPRDLGGSAPTLIFSRPARRSRTLRPAGSRGRLRDPFHRKLRQLRHLHHRSDGYRLEQPLPGRNGTYGRSAPWHAAHCPHCPLSGKGEAPLPA